MKENYISIYLLDNFAHIHKCLHIQDIKTMKIHNMRRIGIGRFVHQAEDFESLTIKSMALNPHVFIHISTELDLPTPFYSFTSLWQGNISMLGIAILIEFVWYRWRNILIHISIQFIFRKIIFAEFFIFCTGGGTNPNSWGLKLIYSSIHWSSGQSPIAYLHHHKCSGITCCNGLLLVNELPLAFLTVTCIPSHATGIHWGIQVVSH